MSDELRLYVWENVLKDYTYGMVCVLAPTRAEAWDQLYDEDATAWWSLQGNETPPASEDYSGSKSKQLKDYLDDIGEYKTDTATEPREATNPEAFVVWGGG